MILGFDPVDGQKIAKWRDSFLWHGAREGELTVGEEVVEAFDRRALTARLTVDGKDVAPPLVDVVVRYAKESALTLAGISQDEPWNKWHAQAWRMEVIGLVPPAPALNKQEQQSTVKENEEHHDATS